MGNELIIIACALLPAIALMAFIYKKDTNPEPPRIVIKGFLTGMAIALPIALIEMVIDAVLAPFVMIPVLGAAINAFCVAAIPEESGKLLALRWLVRKHPQEIDERMDGIVYAVSISMGFAGLENITYLFQNADSWMQVGIARALLAVPGHYAFAVLMGYFFSLWYFGDKSPSTRTNILLVPVLAHGVYDTLCFLSEMIPAIGGLVTMTLFYFCYHMHKYALGKIHEHISHDEAQEARQDTWQEQDSRQERNEWEIGAEALRRTLDNNK